MGGKGHSKVEGERSFNKIAPFLALYGGDHLGSPGVVDSIFNSKKIVY